MKHCIDLVGSSVHQFITISPTLPFRCLIILSPPQPTSRVLPVGDVFLLGSELVDDPAEGEERPVDLAGLPRLPGHRTGPADVLRAGQVHEVQLALDVLLLKQDEIDSSKIIRLSQVRF